MAAFASFGIFLVALLVLMATRTPVAVALAMVTVAGTAIFVSPAALSQLASAAYALSSNFILVVVPMFILMGELLSATGTTRMPEGWRRRRSRRTSATARGRMWHGRTRYLRN